MRYNWSPAILKYCLRYKKHNKTYHQYIYNKRSRGRELDWHSVKPKAFIFNAKSLMNMVKSKEDKQQTFSSRTIHQSVVRLLTLIQEKTDVFKDLIALNNFSARPVFSSLPITCLCEYNHMPSGSQWMHNTLDSLRFFLVSIIFVRVVTWSMVLLFFLYSFCPSSNILKTSPSKTKKISDKNSDIFSYFCSKHRLWILVRTASARRF